ncbi:MAG: hypothetical protein JNL08_13835 [Planctomycetes bacterium]|nr:hypothetical protein [Planctomycetota bacterium]
MRRVLRVLCLACVPLLGGCAWTLRENRPVWNAFEENLVPESPTGFLLALPVTVPLGLVSILADTFVAHPLQVVDDAYHDSADLWRNIDLEHAYYTEAGIVPLRAVATPVWYLLSFLGRSMFAFESPAERDARRVERQQRHERQATAATLRWLRRLANGADEPLRGRPPAELDDELRAALQRAFAAGTALGRIRLYTECADESVLAAEVDWAAGLADPSAVVRYRVLQVIPGAVPVAEELLLRLRQDPDEAVRGLASQFRARQR